MPRIHVGQVAPTPHKPVAWQDAVDEIYHANLDAPPLFTAAARTVRERAFVQSQFDQGMAAVKMHPNLLFFDDPYERRYVEFVNRISRPRVRRCFSIGAIACAYYFYYEVHFLDAYRNAAADDDDPSEVVLYWLSFGLIVPALGLGVAATLVPWGQQRLEQIVACVHLVVAAGLIAKKAVQHANGPIYALVILLILLFNVTGTRFACAGAAGWVIVVMYLAVELAAGPDNVSRAVFSTLNYSMSVVAGMLSSYQKEVLIRRNFMLGLNLSGSPTDAASRIHSPRYAKEELCHRWTQSFKHLGVERQFCQAWYVLDASAVEENASPGMQHHAASMAWRYPLADMCLNQTVLLLQDVINLYGTQTQVVALFFRLGCIIPAYVCLFASMMYLSQKFATQWTDTGRVKAPPSVGDQSSHQPKHAWPTHLGASFVPPSMLGTSKQFKIRNFDLQAGYTPTIQTISSAVVFMHIGLVGALVYIIVVDVGRQDVYSVYFQRLLNATMFAHRSRFRLRFVSAASVTVVLCVVFLGAAHTVLPRRVFLESSTYLCLVQLLGLMVSYEEESLRRHVLRHADLALTGDLSFHVRAVVSSWMAQRVAIGRRHDQDKAQRCQLTAATRESPPPVVAGKSPSYLPSRHGQHLDVPATYRPSASQVPKYAAYTACGSLGVALCQVVSFLAAPT